MVRVSVVLMDGSTVLDNVPLQPGDTVQSLRVQVARALEYQKFKLLSSGGLVLVDTMTIESIGIVDGEQVTVVKVAMLGIFSVALGAFAAVKGDGSVVTWGDANYGGNCDAVQEQLVADVQHVYSTDSAFAAVKP